MCGEEVYGWASYSKDCRGPDLHLALPTYTFSTAPARCLVSLQVAAFYIASRTSPFPSTARPGLHIQYSKPKPCCALSLTLTSLSTIGSGVRA